MITPAVAEIMMGSFCSFKSEKLIWMAPAKSKKLSIAPISTSVKSNSEMRLKKLRVVFGKTLTPKIRMNIETMMAISIMPIVDGSFK